MNRTGLSVFIPWQAMISEHPMKIRLVKVEGVGVALALNSKSGRRDNPEPVCGKRGW
ncbi:hypothetical protein J2Z75_002112 [Rhizobium herbae]|uniref:Uncharacterized protein n=1 Tax=Rhizobium herbae TaxID=508661 RepID=A0ABS4EKY2_9HYPH|nr:hypothetical protein [Rhizobium herbae]